MRIHLQLIDDGGLVLAEGTFESRAITVSPDESADFRHERLPGVMVIETDGYHAELKTKQSVNRLRRKNVFGLTDTLSLRVDLYPRPDAVPVERGRCPSCGGVLRTNQVGGAYRSLAREERRCGDCQTAVLELERAPEVIGLFTDIRADDWVTVTVAQRCPRCAQNMLRSVLRSAKGEAEVERCAPCGLVVVEPEDEVRLLGGVG